MISKLKIAIFLIVSVIFTASLSMAQDEVPDYLYDRGEGVTASLFGTYIKKGDLVVYPFYEYELNTAEEYKGVEVGTSKDTKDYLGRFELHQLLIFLGYGVTDDLALEFETALYETATLEKASDDTTSGMTEDLEESGFGETEVQLRWRLMREGENRPEVYTFVDVAFPFQEDKKLIGISDWEGGIGLGLVKGFSFGTLTPRASIEYDPDDDAFEFGEWAIEYLKRFSDKWRMVATFEGESDEVSLIGEAQYNLNPDAILKLNCGFGLTEKTPDIAPEIGVMFYF